MPISSELTDTQLLQFSRQIMLPQIDVEGQQKLIDAHVLVLGAGGLGCPALSYLATAGIGEIVIVDPDVVDQSNMQRQILYTLEDIGRYKAEVAKNKLLEYGTNVRITAHTKIPNAQELSAWVTNADIVLDGTDNFEARYQHNEACLKAKTPLISGAVIRFEGQLTTFDHRNADSPCYHCLYPKASDEQLNCSENGVLGPVAGIVGTMMATEAIKTLLGIGESLTGRLMLLDALHMDWRSVRLRKDSSCPVCSKE
jgi:molybdopterin/thiamine biosynthesis adenylyltransferase|tara:strand:- start:1477 stop:2241 length:765 start_codon:yes stop_codon:yes gene_type:complete